MRLGWIFWLANTLSSAATLPQLLQLALLTANQLTKGHVPLGRLLSCGILRQLGWATGVPRMDLIYPCLVALPTTACLLGLAWVQNCWQIGPKR